MKGKWMRLAAAALSLCFVRGAAAQAGGDEYVFSTIDHLQGLSSSAVICVFKDRDEFMWFGTYDGLNCFDSRDVDVYRTDFSNSPTLDNNVIYGITQADGNNLWISTLLGVNRFSKDRMEVVANHKVPPGASLISNSLGHTWLASADSIARYDVERGRFAKVEVPRVAVGNPVSSSFVAHDGGLWLFHEKNSEGYVCKVSPKESGNGGEAGVVDVSDSSFHHTPVGSIHGVNDASFFFIDTEGELYLYDVVQQSKVRIRNIGTLMAKYGDITGVSTFYDNIVIAFRTNGLVRLVAERGYEEEVVDRNLRVFDLYNDPEQGVLWLGTDGRGAMMCSRRRSIAVNMMTKSLSDNFTRQVRSIMTDDSGDLWFGTKGDGLIHISDYDNGMTAARTAVWFPEREQTALHYTRDETEFSVFSLKRSTASDGFWVGSGQTGLLRYDYGTDRLHGLADVSGHGQPDEIHGIHELDENTLYVATAAGTGFRKLTLGRRGNERVIEEQTQYRFFHDGQDINTFFAMEAEGDSVLWLGSRESGLVRFDVRTEEYGVVSLSEMLGRSIDDVLSICRTKCGDMYVGTTTGLVRLTFRQEAVAAHHIGREQGFLNDMIHGILEDETGFLWLSTNRGLIKYDPENSSARNYYYSGGLKIGEFSDDAYYKCPYTGRLFFGGVDGLLYIDDTAADGQDYWPGIVPRKLSVGKNAVDLHDHLFDTDGGGELRFRYDKEGFSVSFVAPDFVEATDIEYSWMLEKHDDEWSPFGTTHLASYKKIPPGRYVLHIRYRKDIFNNETRNLSIPVRILPLWYQTAAVRLSVLLLILAVAGVGVRALYRYLDRGGLLSSFSIHFAPPPPEVSKRETGAVGVPGMTDLGGLVHCSSDEHAEFVRRMVAVIEANISSEALGSTMIAERMSVSVRQFYRKFKQVSDATPTEVIKQIRMKRAAELLLKGDQSVLDVMVQIGISSRSHFHREFLRTFGMPPIEYKKRNTGR